MAEIQARKTRKTEKSPIKSTSGPSAHLGCV